MHAWRTSPASRFNPLAQAAGSPRSGEDCTPWTCRCVVARVGGDVILWERRSPGKRSAPGAVRHPSRVRFAYPGYAAELRCAGSGQSSVSSKRFGGGVLSSGCITVVVTGPAGGRLRGGGRPAIEIGRAHVRTPVTNAHLVCRLSHGKKKTQ